MKTYVYTAWVNCPSQRLEEAQNRFLKSCLNFDYIPVFYTDIHFPEQRPKMNELISYAVANCREKDVDWLVWVNSDCEIVKNIEDAFVDGLCIAFYRTEKPDNKYCQGIDMFAIHKSLWDDLIKDMPDMYVGATHIDWWLARYFQKKKKMREVYDYLLHYSHEKTKEAHAFSGDEISQHNIDNFIDWAKRNNVDYHTGWGKNGPPEQVKAQMQPAQTQIRRIPPPETTR